MKRKKIKGIELVEQGSKIVVSGPPGTNMDDIIVWAQRQKAESQVQVAVSLELDCYPLDGAYAMRRAIEEIHGFTGTPPAGFFGPSVTMVGMEVGFGQTVQVPWGPVRIVGIEGEFATSFNPGKGIPNFVISGWVRQKHRPALQKIFDLTKKYIEQESIYKGKAIRLDFQYVRDDEKFQIAKHEPKFWDVSDIHPEELVFEASTMKALELTIFNRIRNTAAMRENRVPLKRGLLMAGPFGCGKTLLMAVAAKIASDNGWTSIYVKDVADLALGLRLAAKLSPAIVMAEDIDQVMTGDRDVSENDILNTIDGADTKGAEIFTLLTTNYPEKVTDALKRQGRCPVIIVNPPDEAAVIKLVKVAGRGLLAADFDYPMVGRMLRGHIPATIREAIEQAKVAAIARVGADIKGHVSTEDAIDAAQFAISQAKFAEPKRLDERNAYEKAADALGGYITKAVGIFAQAASRGHSEADNNGGAVVHRHLPEPEGFQLNVDDMTDAMLEDIENTTT